MLTLRIYFLSKLQALTTVTILNSQSPGFICLVIQSLYCLTNVSQFPHLSSLANHSYSLFLWEILFFDIKYNDLFIVPLYYIRYGLYLNIYLLSFWVTIRNIFITFKHQNIHFSFVLLYTKRILYHWSINAIA